jgi:hypothetical protein
MELLAIAEDAGSIFKNSTLAGHELQITFLRLNQ